MANFVNFHYNVVDCTQRDKVLESFKAFAPLLKGGAKVIVVRQPDTLGTFNKAWASASHIITTEMIRYIAAPNAIIFFAWFNLSEAEVTQKSMSMARDTESKCVFELLEPIARSHSHSCFRNRSDDAINDSLDHYTGVWRCRGIAFEDALLPVATALESKTAVPEDMSSQKTRQELGKRLRNATTQKTFKNFQREIEPILVMYPDLINDPGPSTGNTALHYAVEFAAKSGNTDQVTYLLEQKALSLPDNKQDEPYDLVATGGRCTGKDYPHAQKVLPLLTPSLKSKHSAPATGPLFPSIPVSVTTSSSSSTASTASLSSSSLPSDTPAKKPPAAMTTLRL